MFFDAELIRQQLQRQVDQMECEREMHKLKMEVERRTLDEKIREVRAMGSIEGQCVRVEEEKALQHPAQTIRQ